MSTMMQNLAWLSAFACVLLGVHLLRTNVGKALPAILLGVTFLVLGLQSALMSLVLEYGHGPWPLFTLSVWSRILIRSLWETLENDFFYEAPPVQMHKKYRRDFLTKLCYIRNRKLNLYWWWCQCHQRQVPDLYYGALSSWLWAQTFR